MKTKKILFALLALFLISCAVQRQKSVDRLFSDFSKEKGVTRVGIGKFAMTVTGLFTDAKGVKGVEVLSFGECKNSVVERLNKAIASLNDESYETLASVNEETKHTKILMKSDDEFVRELVILTTGNDPAMIRIKGNIKFSDIENIINKIKSSKE